MDSFNVSKPMTPDEELLMDIRSFGVGNLLANLVGPDVVSTLYTTAVLAAAVGFGLLIKLFCRSNAQRNRRFQFKYMVNVIVFLSFTSFFFLTTGFTIGYSTGYGGRIAVEELNLGRANLTTMVMRAFVSFLLSCIVGMVYSNTCQSPCCGPNSIVNSTAVGQN